MTAALGLRSETLTPWQVHLAALAVAWAALLGLFQNDVADIASIWWNSATFNHCILIPLILGWLVWQRDRTGLPMKLWWAQLALNFMWTPVFFGAHQIGLAFLIILLMLAAILAFIGTEWRQARVTAWLFAPYAVWVAFAAVLNGSIWALN